MPNLTVSKFLWLFYLENKGDGSDAEASTSEEDLILQDEICKSRLASIKRVQSFLPNVTMDYTNCLGANFIEVYNNTTVHCLIDYIWVPLRAETYMVHEDFFFTYGKLLLVK